MKFTLDNAKVADGTILIFGVRYVQTDPERSGPYAASRPFTYAALKAGGRWYMTGTGRVPQDAGWGAVARWLDDPSRQVVWVRAVTEAAELWPNPDSGFGPGDWLASQGEPLLSNAQAAEGDLS